MAERSRLFDLAYAISFASQLGFLVVAPLVGFILAGRWLDEVLHAAPIGLLSGIVLALVTSTYELYQMLLPLLRHDTAPPHRRDTAGHAVARADATTPSRTYHAADHP
jgi:hypothetical protein